MLKKQLAQERASYSVTIFHLKDYSSADAVVLFLKAPLY